MNRFKTEKYKDKKCFNASCKYSWSYCLQIVPNKACKTTFLKKEPLASSSCGEVSYRPELHSAVRLTCARFLSNIVWYLSIKRVQAWYPGELGAMDTCTLHLVTDSRYFKLNNIFLITQYFFNTNMHIDAYFLNTNTIYCLVVAMMSSKA